MSPPESLHETEHAKIEYDESHDAIIINWKRTAENEDFRQVLNDGLDLVREHDATHWLADLREMGTVAPDDQEWTNEQWFPEATQTGLTKMAVVQSERQVQQMSVENIMQEVTDRLTHKYFDNMDEAKDWLES